MHLLNQDAKQSTAASAREAAKTKKESNGYAVTLLTTQSQKHKLIALKSAFYFTQKEIAKMPTNFQNIFTIDIPIHIRQKPNGVFEARYRANGFHISVSSTDFEKLKPKFLAELLKQSNTAAASEPEKKSQCLFFEDVAARWLELKRPSIKDPTLRSYIGLFDANILPVLGSRELSEIRQSDVQELINHYVGAEKSRTALKIYQTLKAVFEFAVGDDLIERSPMRLLKPPKYEEENGKALTLTEEKELIEKIAKSKCLPEVGNALLFLLYTGIRRSELASALIEDDFVRVTCAKTRKGYREKQRLIPLTPMLARHLPNMDLETMRTVRPDALTQAMKRLMPEHHLHELRHTFITRCQECGVAREIVSVWAGHTADSTMTSNVYTHFSREFMLKEAEKVIYNL